MKFSFGQAEQERIEIDVQGYERPACGDYWEDNWLEIDICVRAGGFSGNVEATIMADELGKLLSQLRPLFEILSGSAEFVTIEEQLNLRFSGDGRGHIELHGLVTDKAGAGNRLQFDLQFDQSQLGASIRELERVVKEFPEIKE